MRGHVTAIMGACTGEQNNKPWPVRPSQPMHRHHHIQILPDNAMLRNSLTTARAATRPWRGSAIHLPARRACRPGTTRWMRSSVALRGSDNDGAALGWAASLRHRRARGGKGVRPLALPSRQGKPGPEFSTAVGGLTCSPPRQECYGRGPNRERSMPLYCTAYEGEGPHGSCSRAPRRAWVGHVAPLKAVMGRPERDAAGVWDDTW